MRVKLTMGWWRHSIVGSRWDRISPKITDYLRGKGMPYFAQHEWHGYRINLIPRDRIRNNIRGWLLRRDIVPYFYGPMCFDLGINAPNSKVKDGEVVEYEWQWFKGESTQPLRKGWGCVPLTNTVPFVFQRAKVGEVTHYPSSPPGYKQIRRIHAVDLGHVSKLDQYRVDMRFRERIGPFSEYVTLLEFTLQDRDAFYQNVWLLFIGALIGAAFTLVGGIAGYIMWGR
jgi:hypothetical protein